MTRVVALCSFMCAFVAVSAFAQDKVVVIPLQGNYQIQGTDCPAATGGALAGPKEMYNFCWYLSQDGIRCDQVCADLGGANLAYGAEGKWEDNCLEAEADDVSTWFYNNGNPGNWQNITGGTTYHTLGYGYDGGYYYGKCAAGTLTDTGAYPTETNGSIARNVVCACFGLMQP